MTTANNFKTAGCRDVQWTWGKKVKKRTRGLERCRVKDAWSYMYTRWFILKGKCNLCFTCMVSILPVKGMSLSFKDQLNFVTCAWFKLLITHACMKNLYQIKMVNPVEFCVLVTKKILNKFPRVQFLYIEKIAFCTAIFQFFWFFFDSSPELISRTH